MDNQKLYDLSTPQRSIWVTEEYFKGSPINNICGTTLIKDKVNFNLLEKAIYLVLNNNDIFKTKFSIVNGDIKQYVSSTINSDIIHFRVKDLNELENLKKVIVERPFNLFDSFLYNFYIFELANGYGAFSLNIHHLLSDSWTLGLLSKEIMRAYSFFIRGENKKLIQHSSYIDYINTEEKYINSERYSKDKKYWNDEFKTIPELPIIPGSAKSNDVLNDYSANRNQYSLSRFDLYRITNFCKKNHVSLYNFFMSIYAIYIKGISSLNDFSIGTPILNRTNTKEKNTAGMFINMAALRIRFEKFMTFKEFIKSLSSKSMQLLRHQKYSYQMLLEDLRKRDNNISNLYNITFSYQITNTKEKLGVKYESDWSFNGCSAENITIQIFDLNDTGKLNFCYDYKTSIYNSEDIDLLHARVLNIIHQVLSDESIDISKLQIITPKEKKILLNEFNKTNFNYNTNLTLVDYFERNASLFPKNTAIIYDKIEYSYEELNNMANLVANNINSIIKEKNERIAVLNKKSVWTIACFLGIMKSGNCYIPIDPEYPEDRIKYILEDSECKLLITSKEISAFKKNKSTLFVEDFEVSNYANCYFKNISTPSDLAYMIYTSGTTGKPKGVKIRHKNIINTLIWRKDYYNFDNTITVYQIPSFSFDSSVEDIFTPLIAGGRLVIPSTPKVDINTLCEDIVKYNVNHFLVVPSLYKILLSEKSESLSTLKFITIAGEDFSISLVNEHFSKLPNVRLINEYGPTENSVCSTFYELSNDDSEIFIGTPINNCKCYILNNDLQLLPCNVPGELYVSGPGVSEGYWNKDVLSKEKFIDNPFEKKFKLYKTGDVAKYNSSGLLKFLGRADNQIKINGFRVELKEIEKNILNNSEIVDTVVTKKTDLNEKPMLIAYIITKKEDFDIISLTNSLREHLPVYMIPYIVKVDSFPLTPNGKIDVGALPLPDFSSQKKNVVKARDNLDKKLISLVKESLNVSNVSLLDSIFSLGGDSLAAITISAKISSLFGVKIGIKELLSGYTIKDLSDYIKKNVPTSDDVFKIEKSENMNFYPLSSAQRRLYYNTKMVSGRNTLYNLPGAVLIDKKLDHDKIQNIFNTLIENHSSLRTSFVIHEDKVVQKVFDNVFLEIPFFENKKDEVEELMQKFPRPFNLEKAPLLRVEIHYIDNKNTLLLIDSHHIIMDGMSLNNLIKEFNLLYNGEKLLPSPIQYTDYSVWENDFLSSDQILQYENYWIKKFDGSDFSELNLPYDYTPSNIRTYKGKKITKTLGTAYFSRISKIAIENNVSPYMLFLSAFFVLLYKYTGQKDINVGTPIQNRDNDEIKNLIGMFVNNIVVRGKIDSSLSFKDFLTNIRSQVLDDFSNQPYPFDMLVKKLGITSDLSKNPLFDVMFIFQNHEESSLIIDNKNYPIMEIENNVSKFNLSLEIKPDFHQINIEYRSDLFKESTVDKLLEHYLNIMDIILDDISILIKDISSLSSEENNKILKRFNATSITYKPEKTIFELFEEQVALTPNRVSIVFENKSLTYKELNKKSNQLANLLRSKYINPNDIIGIMLPRSIDLIVSILGVLKSGACYIPIDPTFPEKRIEYMLDNSGCKLLITTNELYNNIDFKDKICINDDELILQSDKNLPKVNSPDDLSYIIYTSGSTGTPKGVMLKHKSLSNLCAYLNQTVDFLKDDCIYKNMASITTASFDIFIFETLICLQKGLKIVLANEDEQRIPSLLDILIKKNDVQLIQMTPSRMQIFLDNIQDMPHLSNLKYVVLAGEPLPLALRNSLLDIGVKKVYNGYGPSETTVFSSFTDVTKLKEINIGKPLGNTQMYILDDDLTPVPIGVAGELYIAGDGIGKGYINREDLTLERYIKNPFEKNSIMYKTGDLCKYNNSGEIFYLGRIDNQVKIRGLRIELEEIENKILDFPNIKKAKVIKQIIGNREIISAYYISEKRIKITALRRFLYESLPKYMIPSYFTALDDFPYTPNGKIDKNALPIPSGILKNEKVGYIAPKTDLEKKLVSIWEDILNTSPIGLKDNFFELGGDSILAMTLNIKLLKITNKINYSDIFSFPTISELIEKINLNISSVPIEGYDDLKDKYKDILSNNMLLPKDIKSKRVGNILLTGATGFLGIHILDKFLKMEKGKAYLLIRKDPGSTIEEKLLNKLHYYFGNKYDKYIHTRIILIEGDICKDGFGLNQDALFNLGNSIDSIVNSAAKVSHYGTYQDFYNTNVKAVEKIIDFANLFNKRIFQISTLSVSGDYSENNITFAENDFYINQNLENVYVKSKFEAEKRLLDAVLKGTDVHILRVGNLMPRFVDGKFQENADENAFLSRLATFMKIGSIPDYLKNSPLEFTPVDSTSSAILKIMQYTNPNNIIYHIFNHNYISFNNLNVKLDVVSPHEFKAIIKKILDGPNSDILNTLINDLDKDSNINYDNKIEINSSHTIKFLKRCGFEWPKIDNNYILNIQKLIGGNK